MLVESVWIFVNGNGKVLCALPVRVLPILGSFFWAIKIGFDILLFCGEHECDMNFDPQLS